MHERRKVNLYALSMFQLTRFYYFLYSHSITLDTGFVVCRLFKINFFKKLFQKLSVSNSLDTDQDLHSGSKGYQQTTKFAASKES